MISMIGSKRELSHTDGLDLNLHGLVEHHITYTWFGTCCVRNQGTKSCCFQSEPRTSSVICINYINKWKFVDSKVFVLFLLHFMLDSYLPVVAHYFLIFFCVV